MRYVVKNEQSKTSILDSRETRTRLNIIAQTGNKKLINDAIYRESYLTSDGRRSRVEDQLALAYKNKCAYCERLCKADIEHYRPKGGVTEAPSHPGYYWLCYEWSNLLPACITCNREGSKHNQFPILGARVYRPTFGSDRALDILSCKASNSPLLEEIPFLLHPEIDRPEDFFAFKVDPNGEGVRIVGIDKRRRGEKTIEICLLNRMEVRLDRVQSVIDDFKIAIHCLFYQLATDEISESEVVDKILYHVRLLKEYSLREDKTHTFLRRYIVSSVDNFRQIILPFLVPKIREIVLAAFVFLLEKEESTIA